MESQVIAAMIAASTSLLISIFGLLTARTAKARALAAEDAAKQTELVRSKALNATEEITFALGKLLEVTRTMRLTCAQFESKERFITQYQEPVHRFTDNFINAYYKSLVYLDESLTKKFFAIREMLIYQETSEERLEKRIKALEQFLNSVSTLARERYLPVTGGPNESFQRTALTGHR